MDEHLLPMCGRFWFKKCLCAKAPINSLAWDDPGGGLTPGWGQVQKMFKLDCPHWVPWLLHALPCFELCIWLWVSRGETSTSFLMGAAGPQTTLWAVGLQGLLLWALVLPVSTLMRIWDVALQTSCPGWFILTIFIKPETGYLSVSACGTQIKDTCKPKSRSYFPCWKDIALSRYILLITGSKEVKGKGKWSEHAQVSSLLQKDLWTLKLGTRRNDGQMVHHGTKGMRLSLWLVIQGKTQALCKDYIRKKCFSQLLLFPSSWSEFG